MLKKVILPLLALAGATFAIFMIFFSARKPPVTQIIFQPSSSPYQHYVAGQGTVEAISEDIMIGVPFPELVTKVFVDVGQIVKKGDPLFKLDTRHLEAELMLAMQEQKLAETNYQNTQVQLAFYDKLNDKSAVSEQDYATAFYNNKLAQQQVNVTQATVNIKKTDIERSLIVAPCEGEILQLNVEAGEVANINPFNNIPLIIFGDTTYYHLRVDIDEEDSWRIVPGAPATAFIRGNSNIFIPLEFVYLEPYVVPKKSLRGSDFERVDTRVLQLVYRFSKNQFPVYIGQLLDVYVEAKPSEAAR